MEGFGAWLKREREMRGVSLREVAQATRIGMRALEALEEERFEELGADIFIKGFLRSYARYLGINADEVVLRYEEHTNHQSMAPDLREVRGEKMYLIEGRQPIRKVIFALGAVILLSLAGWALFAVRSGVSVQTAATLPEPAPLPLPVTEATLAVTAPAETVEIAPEPPGPPARKPMELEVQADQVSYVKIGVDGREPEERMMQSGTIWRVRGDERIELLTGNAGGVTVIYEGRSLGRFGEQGRVRRKVFSREGAPSP